LGPIAEFPYFVIIVPIMAKLSKEEVEHIAELARLELTEEEKELFTGQLSSILEYVDKLSEVDTSKVDPKAYVLDVKNVTREDEIASPPHSHEILLNNMPSRKGDLLKVPPVFEQGKE
jgi:aspartyl-tRNA(Asn)/glutamyl-tRNA(Gln) amidotransferase subunit C